LDTLTREELRWIIDNANMDETSRTILKMHYIDGRYLAYIEGVTGYSATQIYRKHRAAMVIVERLIASGALSRRK
jgi:hypothetical protein